ncbi:hypothetical protein ANN_20120 [Periplaneta americana]|uniref:Endonuclease-reverse transcriptase n=1 Tax=Periplaneta americana TaxID=6978 RepID=A0ABQ8SC52_PERAM|nr:hypothetical protein ANN_20120 [Periplaneta americana]
MIMSRDENIVRNGNTKIGNLSFEDVEKFKYLGATVTNINDTREEIKHRINMGNACYYSAEKHLSSSLLSKNLKVRIYKTVILPVVLYGCETWTLTLREEQRLRVFENKVLRKIFGAKRDEVTGEWRKLHNTELHALYSSPDIIRNIKSRRLRWAGHVARMGESRNAYRVLVGRPEEKRPLGRPRRGLEDNIKMDLRRWNMMIENGLILLRIGTNGGLCEGGNEPPGFLKANTVKQKQVLTVIASYLETSEREQRAEGRKRVTWVEPTELFAHAPHHNLLSRNIELFPSLRTSSVTMEQQPQGSNYGEITPPRRKKLDLCKVEVDDFDQHVIRDTIEEFYRVQKVVPTIKKIIPNG